MTGAPIIEPNLHAALVHFPIAMIALGLVLEVFSWLWHRSGARSAGRWMLVIGIFACIPTATTGLYALRQTVAPGMVQGEAWSVIAGNATWTDAHWEVMEQHIRMTAWGSAILLAAIVIWIAASDVARGRLYIAGILVAMFGGGMVLYGAYFGGRLVYRHSTGVGLVEASAVEQVAEGGVGTVGRLGQIVSPMELHTLAAGLTVAMILAALGLSVRRSNVAWENHLAEQKAVAAGYRPAGQLGQKENVLSIPTVYPGRFWTLAVIFGLATVATGLWLFGVWPPTEIRRVLAEHRAAGSFRPVMHGYGALLIVGLSLMLGVLLRFSPRRRMFLGVFSTLLVLIIGIQMWSGVLMLFDSSEGSPIQFQKVPATQPKRVEFGSVIEPTTRAAGQDAPMPPAAGDGAGVEPATLPVEK